MALLLVASGLAAVAQEQSDEVASLLNSAIRVTETNGQMRVLWPISEKANGSVIFNLDSNKPLIASVGASSSGMMQPILNALNPELLLTVGERDLRPAGWVVFFDDPPRRPFETFRAELGERRLKVTVDETRTTVSIASISAGDFYGDLRFTFYRNSPFFRVEAVMKTQQDSRAILYDMGLTSKSPNWKTVAWNDTELNLQRVKLDPNANATSVAVAGRTIVAEGVSGTVAAFPAPHQYFYPLDEAFNLKFVWHGKNYGKPGVDCGFGIRQEPIGDKRHVPWFNAPPNTEQHLGMFVLVTRGDAKDALSQVASYTRGDHFKKLPGFLTFTSHYHIEHSREFMEKQRSQNTTGIPRGLEAPGFVKTFKARGVDMVHLAEFHYEDGSKLPDEQRFRQLKIMHDECRRLSDDELMVLPGEEPNVQLGGHWLSLFPKPIYWALSRANKPFTEQVEGYGTVYRVGSPADMLQLMEKENGLMWTAHARIKASQGFPDRYNDETFFHSDHFLGAAWKAMEADLSRPTLGWRVLNLLDEMSNWGLKKQVLGEVDTFRMEPDYETYGHMNINYLKLDKLPRFDDGWQPVLDALRGGQFFVTTGEILIPKFSIGEKESGDTLDIVATSTPMLEADLEWTFPMAFAEVVSGDGHRVYRQRIDLANTEGFGARKLRLPLDLKERAWVRFEAWDIAANGAFTQPIWLTAAIVSPTIAKTNPEPATFARFVPERKDDFAWENDLVAFRVYGPAIRPGMENSGIDCWTKRVRYPIIDKWYSGEHENGISYHEDHGEGCDLYSVGSSRGCGGTAIWKNGRMYLAGPFKTWKVISTGKQKSVFELNYEYNVDGEIIQEVKRIDLELGQRLFQSESTFTKDGKPAALDIAIGVTTHDGKAKMTLNAEKGWMACWENIQGTGLGTGVVIAPSRVVEMRDYITPATTEQHALLLTRTDPNGKTVHFAGFGWTKAREITTPEQWHEYLAKFAGTVN